jgi:hypothetical protein
LKNKLTPKGLGARFKWYSKRKALNSNGSTTKGKKKKKQKYLAEGGQHGALSLKIRRLSDGNPD